MIQISPRQLQVFVQIAAAGTVRGAAEWLHLTQPAVSMALAELERHLEAPLFDRHRGRLRLNARGQELLPMARELLERLDEFGRRAGSQAETLSGQLHLGASNTVGNYRVGEWLGDFVQRHPQVGLELQVGNTDAMVTALLEHRLDLACVEGPVHHAALEVRPWREDSLVVCARPEHPLASRAGLEPADFAAERWILRERGSATRALTERALEQLPAGTTVLELGQVEAIKQAVIAGLGLACLPEVAVTDAVAAGRLVVLPTPFLDLRRRLSLILHRQHYRSALLEAFLATMPTPEG
ncbi:LysR family transcriptional regulator [Oleiagrimonas sp. C23AA]|uniref:LysR family transcriptional regulator n=1 Tax=Oleiagrimonas sp. C23AA TaxID=2719047 RepID=UPI0014204BF6|nr:LysR family transcriptional regulator [Oleiagrimonas sp. C23AA]NII11513.1 LysR family transcriptional regulator [Oleiagrimonas sp. C23AA]